MRQCIALAGMVCLLASGCATGGWMRGGQAGHVTASQRAPRPTISRDFRKPGPEPAVQLAAFNGACDSGCGMCETACGCAVGGNGCFGSGQGYDCGGCGQCGPCRRIIDGVASGFCGPCGVCPHGGGYPEYPTYNPGPPVGQVAYPYYTVRGPRDFLRDNPPSIGPY